MIDKMEALREGSMTEKELQDEGFVYALYHTSRRLAEGNPDLRNVEKNVIKEAIEFLEGIIK